MGGACAGINGISVPGLVGGACMGIPLRPARGTLTGTVAVVGGCETVVVGAGGDEITGQRV